MYRVAAAWLAVVALAGCRDKPPADWVARLASTAGRVTVAPRGGGPTPAKKGAYLRPGARLETGSDGRAELSLRSGGRLAIKPNSVVSLGVKGASDGDVDLVLAAGQVVSTTPQARARALVIQVGDRRVRLSPSARATISATAGGSVSLQLGSATVEGPGGRRAVVRGAPLQLQIGAEPDAPVERADGGGAASDDDGAAADGSSGDGGRTDGGGQAAAKALSSWVTSRGRGRAWLRGRGGPRRRLRRGRAVRLTAGAVLTLGRRARAVVGPRGGGSLLQGPAKIRFSVGRGAKGAAPGGRRAALHLVGRRATLRIERRGRPGDRGPELELEGGRLATSVAYRRLSLDVQRGRENVRIRVHRGNARFTAKSGRELRLEAGQSITLQDRSLAGPKTLPRAPLVVRRGGRIRAFVRGRKVPLTLSWKAPKGGRGALVEVARDRRFRRPIFADVLRRSELTLPAVRRGTLYWRVRQLDAGSRPAKKKLVRGRLVVLRDTSHRRLRTRPPHNLIRGRDAQTTVYYQNALPRFSFRWARVADAERYKLKVFSESNLAKPLLVRTVEKNHADLRPGALAEGRYLWYVAAFAGGKRAGRSSGSRRLRIRYDNATANLQIVYPRDGLVVSDEAIVVRGVTVPGSKLLINGRRAQFDESYRFRHRVALQPGPNAITFKVRDAKRGTSVYHRRVVRR